MNRTQRSRGWAGALALATASCGPADCAGGRTVDPSPPAAASGSAAPAGAAPASAAPTPAPPPPRPAGLDKIPEPPLQKAFVSWTEGRHAEAAKEGARLRWSIESASTGRFLNVDGSYANTLVRERVEGPAGSDAGCEEALRAVEIQIEASRPEPKIDDRLLGVDCCRDACEERPPFGYMLDYADAVAKRDIKALARLVDPSGELTVTIRMIVDGDSDEQTFHERGAALSPKIIHALSPFHVESASLSCSDFGPEGKASCSAFGGGWEASYVWERAGKQAYLREVSEKSH